MGQAATMRDWYVLVAFLLSTGSIVLVIIFRRSVKASLFDTDFARLAHLTNSWIEWLLLGMLVATVIVSIRLMGVVLMSAVLIFPAVSARLLTSSFEKVLLIATILGGVCGFGGVMLSHKCALAFQALSGHSLWLPTGPLIALLLTGTFCVVLLFSPSEGLAIRAWRRFLFVRRCQRENILKMMWKECSRTDTWRLRKGQLRELFSIPPRAMKKVVRGLKRTGYLHLLPEGGVEMTPQGILMGRKLVRLHRLWELYLVEFCGMPRERVHPNAEEMEHILTPEIESELSALLHNPSFDPHAQPIPTAEKEFLSNGYRT
jgi:manganese/zinc/iron transport system permease protein